MPKRTRLNRTFLVVLGLIFLGLTAGIAAGWVEMHLSQPLPKTIDLPFITGKFLRIVLLLIGAYLVRRILIEVLRKVLSNYIPNVDLALLDEDVEKKRAETLVSVFSNLASFAIGAAAILVLLSEIGVDAAPIIAGVGFLGLGVGFASQTLVKDYISGFFILLENQFNIGDSVEVGGKKGTVKELSLRTTILEDAEGNIHIVPNNKIAIVTRFKKGS